VNFSSIARAGMGKTTLLFQLLKRLKAPSGVAFYLKHVRFPRLLRYLLEPWVSIAASRLVRCQHN